MKKTSTFGIIIIFLVIGITAWFLISNFSFTTYPEGVPNDYYDRIDLLEDNDIKLYVYSNNIDFNDDYEYISVSNLFSLSAIINDYGNFLVIDMNKYKISEFTTEEEIQYLYNVKKITIFIVNYASSESDQLINFVDDRDFDSDLIIYSYDSSLTNYTATNSGDFPTDQMLMYAILDQIAYIIEENSVLYE